METFQISCRQHRNCSSKTSRCFSNIEAFYRMKWLKHVQDKNSSHFITFWLDLAKRGMRDGKHELSAYTTLQTLFVQSGAICL